MKKKCNPFYANCWIKQMDCPNIHRSPCVGFFCACIIGLCKCITMWRTVRYDMGRVVLYYTVEHRPFLYLILHIIYSPSLYCTKYMHSLVLRMAFTYRYCLCEKKISQQRMSDQLSFDSAEISTARAFYDFFFMQARSKGFSLFESLLRSSFGFTQWIINGLLFFSYFFFIPLKLYGPVMDSWDHDGRGRAPKKKSFACINISVLWLKLPVGWSFFNGLFFYGRRWATHSAVSN